MNNKVVYNLKRLAYPVVRVALFILLANLLFGQSAVHANYSALPSLLHSDYNFEEFVSSNHPGGASGNFTPKLSFLFYTQNDDPSDSPSNIVPHSTSVDLVNSYTSPPSCSDLATIEQFAVDDNRADGQSSLQGGAFNPSCSNIGSGGLRITNLKTNHFSCSGRFNPAGSCPYLVTIVTISVTSSNQFFTDVRVADSATDGLSYIGRYDQTVTDSSVAGVSLSLNQDAPRDGQGYGNIAVNFAAPCNYNGGRAYFHWKDADSGTSPNNFQSVTVKLEQYINGNWKTISGPVDAGNSISQIYSRSFNPIPGGRYKLVFNHVIARSNSDAANTIKVWYPFDTAADAVSCNTTPPTTAIECLKYDNYDGQNGHANLADHSIYRFTVFHVDQNHVTGYPSTFQNWESYNASPDYQQVINTNTSLNDGNSVYNAATNDYKLIFPSPAGPDWQVYVEHWLHYDSNGNGTLDAWKYTHGVDATDNCYSGNCAISVDGNLPDGSSNVMAGSDYGATAFVNNTGLMPLQLGGNYIGSGASNFPVPIDTPTAPTTQGTTSVSASVLDGTVGSYTAYSCPASVNVYQHFKLIPTAGIDAGTDSQDPQTVSFSTHVKQATTQLDNDNIPYPYTNPVGSNTHSKLLYNNATVKDVPNTDNYGNRDYDGITYDNSGNPNNAAGDQWCPVMKIDNAHGWIGPGPEIPDNPQDISSSGGCMTVVNKPYFKVYGGGVCSDNELASWNHNSGTYPSTFGASTQVGALSVNSTIYGFASGQSDSGSSSRLSFASSPNTSNDYSPSIGGLFGGSSTCETVFDAPTVGATAVTGKSKLSSILANNHLGPSDKVAIYSDDDIYIDEDVAFDGAGTWTADAIPSFVLKTTGNIYIGSGVTRLDGLYDSDKTIYTCGHDTYTPFAESELFSCNQQLVVHGSFVAKKVNLMRTFGSLRDEKPNFTAGSGSNLPLPLDWAHGGPLSQPPAGDTCLNILEPGDPNTWADNVLCTPPTDTGIKLAWTYNSLATNVQDAQHPNCTAMWGVLLRSLNYPNAQAGNWDHDQACSNYPISFQQGQANTFGAGTSQRCTQITEDYSANGYTWPSNVYLCVKYTATSPDTYTPNVVPNCGNAPTGFTRFNRGSLTNCAAEVFDFSPDMYLSHPGTDSHDHGALHYDAITSLPPVL